MLLDEKEEDAEAHEGEKEALWRRIQARRVLERGLRVMTLGPFQAPRASKRCSQGRRPGIEGGMTRPTATPFFTA